MSDTFRVVGTEQLLHSRVFDVERRTVRHGAECFDRDVVTHGGAVSVLAVDDRERVGLISQYRAPFDDFVLEIPAGTLDVVGEDPLDAAKRELLEELGCRAATWRALGRFMVSPGWCTQVMHVFEARGLAFEARQPAGPEEASASIQWLAVDELRATLRAAGIADSTTVVALHRVFGTFFDLD